MQHQPVLLSAVVAGLNLQPNQNVIDCTFGRGGHTAAFLKAIAPSGRVLSIDADTRAFDEGLGQFSESEHARLICVNDSFQNLAPIAADHNWTQTDAIFLDLGVSSPQFDDPSYGMSFRQTGPLDMRFNKKQKLTAAEIINQWSETQIQNILKEYGNEPRAIGLARAIVEKRRTQKINTTTELAEIIEKVYRWRGGKIHPATKTFQALRIAVNDELGALREVLPQAIKLVKSGGRIGVISFHSGEDRIAKEIFRQAERDQQIKRINKHVIKAEFYETKANPRSRSAKLRLVIKI